MAGLRIEGRAVDTGSRRAEVVRLARSAVGDSAVDTGSAIATRRRDLGEASQALRTDVFS